MDTASLFASVVPSGTIVIQRGTNAIFRCPFHNDGESVDSWNCTGYPDGRFFCYSSSCNAWGSLIDLAVFSQIGRRLEPGQKLVERDVDGKVIRVLDEQMLEAYRNVRGVTGGIVSTASPSRSFTEIETAFLEEIQKFSHSELDADAQRYLRGRGVDPSWPIFGVMRPRMMQTIHEIARSFGNTNLPMLTGLESNNEDYKGKMHYLLMDSVVVFQKGYYQARSFRKDRRKPYYDPPKIHKMPLAYGDGPMLVAEGFFKVAWAIPYGFRAVGLLGKSANHYPDTFWTSLQGQLYLGDNDAPDKDGIRAGYRAARLAMHRVDLLGGDPLTILMPPDPYKDTDMWAKDIGYARAAASIRRLHPQYVLDVAQVGC